MRKRGSSLVHGILFMLLICTVAMARTGLSDTLNSIDNYTGSVINADDASQVKYAVIFDAGSTGTRVHVFKFNAHGDHELLLIGNPPKYEYNNKTEPGLSSFAGTPAACVAKLVPLLAEAVKLIEPQLRSTTPVWLGATGGLRLLPELDSGDILNTVKELFEDSGLSYHANHVSIIEGYEEGSYMWFAVNYLLGNLRKPYEETVAVVDLGGASVQMAYAISEETAGRNSRPGEDYIANWSISGTQYALYTHSYLGYGLEAARANLLKLTGRRGNPCIATGYNGTFNYAGVNYHAKAPDMKNEISMCLYYATKVLNKTSYCPPHKAACAFDGFWNGGGGPGQNNLYVASSFYYTAVAANIIGAVDSAIVRPKEYWDAARLVCKTPYNRLKLVYVRAREKDLPFLCMNLVYEYSLLLHGFGVGHQKEITVVKNMEYKGSKFEAAWPLGAAIPLLFTDAAALSLYRPSNQSPSTAQHI